MFLFGRNSKYFLFSLPSEEELKEKYDVGGLMESRRFKGNNQLGWKLGFCMRDLGIYGMLVWVGTIVLFLNLATGHIDSSRIAPISFSLMLLGIMPVALDGTLQMIAEIIWRSNTLFPQLFLALEKSGMLRFLADFVRLVGSDGPFYVSDNLKRLITGSVMGGMVGLWLFPTLWEED